MEKQQGFIIKYIFWIVIAVLILSFFGFNLEEFMNSDTVIKNLGYLKKIVINLWESNLQPIYEWLLHIFGDQIFDAISSLQINDSNSLNSNILKTPTLPGM